MHSRARAITATVIITVFLGTTNPAHAADTVETWGVGATDVDFYAGYGGLGLRQRTERSVFGDLNH